MLSIGRMGQAARVVLPIQLRPDGRVQLRLHVKPGARQTQITDMTENAIGLQVAAPPREGAANEEVVRWVASILGLRPRQVELVAGLKSRDKTVLVEGLDEVAIRATLQTELDNKL
ncbi:hypothetical protein PSACC_01119 [Paramicrosporidium saccamoebae]|uniref:Uncharacterized protein n=1 Tax=Paramicrosporidium saccamoebae TaxID=1246581 RepID=A0A2H9TMV5_9FUNG|nr:hypothetical protein PSACC_01119 [Paramicrosporidium saccamoebae]